MTQTDQTDAPYPAPDPSATAPRKRRRGLTVRMLMLAVLVVGGGLGWIAQLAREQRKAVAAIEGAGGVVTFDWQIHSDLDAEGDPISFLRRGRHWLRGRLGPGFFEDVVDVKLYFQAKADDSLMIYVSQFPYLETLVVDSSKLTDAGLVHVRNLRYLRNLVISSRNVTGRGVANLAGLTRLVALCLETTSVDDAGLAPIENLTGLTLLSLANSRVTDDAIVRIGRLKALNSLVLDGNRITDAGLMHLIPLSAGMTHGLEVSVNDTKVTPEGIAAIKVKCPLTSIVR
jgi:hypothetical protein